MATLETRWGRRLGWGLGAMAALTVIATTTVGAPAVEGRPPPVCADATAGGAASADGTTGLTRAAWYRIEPVLANGARAAQRLDVGVAGGPSWTIPLDAESFAGAPDDGRVVIGTDDGRRSTISVVDLARGCMRVVAVTTDVVRNAVLAADGGAIIEHRVRRSDRADLGIWRRTTADGTSERILAAVEPDARFGITFLTTLQWATDGRHLGIASCGEVACRLRVLDTVGGSVRAVADPGLGELVGLDADRAVMRGACRGLPCPILDVGLDGAHVSPLSDAAGTADLVVDDRGRAVVAFEHDGPGGPLSIVPLGGAATAAQRTDLPADLHIADHDAVVAVDLPPGWVLLARPDAPDDPTAWIRDARVHRLADGAIRRLDEVSP